MAFPETGEYVFPRGLAPLTIDREADTGLYFEPNVWVVHTAAQEGLAISAGRTWLPRRPRVRSRVLTVKPSVAARAARSFRSGAGR